jgi:glucose/arabinose dehydrogenase
MRKLAAIIVVLLVIAGAAAYVLSGESAKLSVEDGYGPNPKLPEPRHMLVPTVNVADASSWPAGVKPKPADGMNVAEFAGGFDHPRWLRVLPNGDVLVAETNAPPQPKDKRGVTGWVEGLMMRRAGADAPSANRITLLRDADGDGVAETRETFLTGLNSPFGMTLSQGKLYIANTDAIVAVPY